MSDKIVIGVFDDYTQAGKAVETLHKAGFEPKNISILGSEPEELRMVAADVERHAPDKVVTTCGALGAVGGLLVGLATLAIPGLGAFLAAGPLMAALSGAAAGGMMGVVAGALIHFDVPEYEAKVLEAHLSEGKVLVAVHTESRDQFMQAEDIMDDCGAIELDIKSEHEAKAGAAS